MKQIILFGAGGHAAVIIDILKAQILAGSPFEIKGFLDDSNKEAVAMRNSLERLKKDAK